MIDTALLLLRNELTNFLTGKDPANVVIDNIGLLETANGNTLTENIVITLVNIEEESALKNQSPLKRPFIKSAIYQNPPVYLNLYVLFTCNFSGDHYQLALRRLSISFSLYKAGILFRLRLQSSAATLDLSQGLTFRFGIYTRIIHTHLRTDQSFMGITGRKTGAVRHV